MKKIWWILIIILLLVVAYYGYRYYQNRNIPKAKGGRLPSQDDINCATGGGTGSRMIIGSCTRPRIPLDANGNLPKPMKQKCFTSDELGLNEGDSGPSIVTDNNGFGTTWYFNFQSGNNFCYTNPQWYTNS